MKGVFNMKTTKMLLESKTYLNGSPIYMGDTNRMFTSQLNVTVTARIVKAPEGAQILMNADPELIQRLRRLPHGTIGAIKAEGDIPSNTVIAETVVPTGFADTKPVYDEILKTHSILEHLNTLVFNCNGKDMNFKEFKALHSRNRTRNESIRNEWGKRGKSLSSHGASQQEILDEKINHYRDYVSPSEYTMVIAFTITHIVNKPSLKATIVDNMTEQQYNLLDYEEKRMYKVATYNASLISIPLVNREVYNSVVNWYKNYTTIGGMRTLNMPHFAVIHEGEYLDGKPVDFDAIKMHDKGLSNNKS